MLITMFALRLDVTCGVLMSSVIRFDDIHSIPLPDATQRALLLHHFFLRSSSVRPRFVADLTALIPLSDGMPAGQIQRWMMHVMATSMSHGRNPALKEGEKETISYLEFVYGLDDLRKLGQVAPLYQYPSIVTGTSVVTTPSVDALTQPLTAIQVSTLSHTYVPYGLLPASPQHDRARNQIYGLFIQLFTASHHRVQWTPHMPLAMGKYNRFGKEQH